ncbi:Trans-aconitate 2-methyltransferase [Escovopsis weberi]|uniref:Trans-aconitate 2-methyltransferase n=1 Tax=Escovopsis weberi TaxID=150374 RepID=A0A0M8MZF6_ESCWE|nr:Trans-aconitate 2-methyltransferase [Escovopsis weberi]
MDGNGDFTDPAAQEHGDRPPSISAATVSLTVGSSHEARLIRGIENGEDMTNGEFWDDTHSLTDSIRQHIIDGGSRYHAYHAGKYAFPNDETEQYRDDLKHDLTIHLCEGAYFFAPIHEVLERGAEVLDLGVGNGRWCMEMADQFPKTTFHGMDLSPIQPDWVPENVQFVVDDIEHEGGWTYPEESFDYIHLRHVTSFISDRPQLWERILQHLKPGGYLEVTEFEHYAACDDNSCDGPFAWRDFLEWINKGLNNLGGDFKAIRFVVDELAAAGFAELQRTHLKCPVGPWAKRRQLQECGHIMRDVCLTGLSGLCRKPFRDGLGWTPVQGEMLLVDVRKSLMATDANGLPLHHSYFPFHSIVARKPLR